MVALHPNMLTNIAPQKERGGGVPYHRMCRGWGGSDGDRVTWRRHPHPRRTQVYLPAPSLLLRSVIPLGIIAVCWGCKVLILASTAATITPPLSRTSSLMPTTRTSTATTTSLLPPRLEPSERCTAFVSARVGDFTHMWGAGGDYEHQLLSNKQPERVCCVCVQCVCRETHSSLQQGV
jgi:hypothetical protein